MNENNFVLNPFCQEGTIYENGYGMIAKNVMRDKKLTPEAKCIYSYIVSFAGARMSAFPSRESMLKELNMSKSRFYKHRQQLIDSGYLKVTQEKGNGKFLKNIYNILLTPCPQNEYTQNEDTNNNSTKSNSIKRYLQFSTQTVSELFSDRAADYINTYLNIYSMYFTKDHVRVKQENIEYITNIIDEVINNSITLEEWIEAIEEYFQELPSKNNGSIIYFLKALPRYFDELRK